MVSSITHGMYARSETKNDVDQACCRGGVAPEAAGGALTRSVTEFRVAMTGLLR